MTPRYITIPASALAVVLATSVFTLVLPAWRAGAHLDNEIGMMRAELARPSDGPEVIERLESRLNELRTTGRERMIPIPETSDIAGLVTYLSGALNRMGLTQREITTGAEVVIDDTKALPISITIRGPFGAIFEAIGEIERLPRLVRVERLRLAYDARGVAESFDAQELRADLVINVFYGAKGEQVEEFAAADRGDAP